MQTSRATSLLREKYVAGPSADSGRERAMSLIESHGIRSSLFYMGEYVDDPNLVTENIENKLAIVDALANQSIDIHVSVDPTQIGYQIAPEQVEQHAQSIAKAIQARNSDKDGVHCLMFDMEDEQLNDPTIALHNALQDRSLPVALTLQAYLRRTYRDMERQIGRGSRVRLVKGAFAAGPSIAFQSQAEIKTNSRRLISLMLSQRSRTTGFYPIIATHDTRLHDFAIDTARKNGWRAGEYEFEMLLGVRGDVARQLAAKGERVRLYVPFGRDWWPHAVRRIGENPRNAVLLARSLLQ